MKARACLVFYIVWYAVVTGSSQDPSAMARQLYYAYDSAWQKGDFNKAEYYLEHILNGQFQLPDYNLAVVHNALGLVLYETGRFDQAIENYQAAFKLSDGQPGSALSLRLSIHNNMALLLNWLGDHANALEYFDKSIRLLDSLPERNSNYFKKYGMLQFNKSIAYTHLGNPEEALEHLNESKRIKELYHHPYLGSVYFNLAMVHNDLGNELLSNQYFKKGINRWIAEKDSSFFQLANIYLQYGQFQVDQGKREEGYVYLQLALQNYKANVGEKHPLTAACYEQMARYHLEGMSFNLAAEYAQKALISGSADFYDSNIHSNPSGEGSIHHLTSLKIYSTKVIALEGLAKQVPEKTHKLEILNVALETNSRSLELLQKLRESFLSRESRLHLTANQKDLYGTGIRLNMRMFHQTGKEEYKERSYVLAAMSKSTELISELRTKEKLYLESLNDTLSYSILRLGSRMDQYSQLIQLQRSEVDPDSSRISYWQEQLFQLSETYNKQREQLSRLHPQMHQSEYLAEDLSLDAIRRKLHRKETLVEYFISAPAPNGSIQLYTFVVTRKKCHVNQALMNNSFDMNLDSLMIYLHEFNPYTENVQSYQAMKKAMFEIYRELIEPVESHFTGRKLIVVPDEKIAFLPFDALIYRHDNDSILDYAGLSYLMNRYDITYANNSQLINRPGKLKLSFPETLAWLPEYSSSGEESKWALDGADEEIKKILDITKGSRMSADRVKVDSMEFLKEEKIMHLAMHAREGRQTGGSPYFLLNPGADSILTGRLYDFEINAMNLISPMVVLSSCRTGSGQLREGEGIMSLSRSFLLAGAGSVIHTLWPVEDPKGPEIMLEFYQGLKRGKSKGRALTNSKLQYLANNPPSYTHPYYWASFQIIGDPHSLTVKWIWVFLGGFGVFVLLLLSYRSRRIFLSRT